MENFPQIDLFPRLSRIGSFIGGLVRHLPDSGYPSSHGGGPLLDEYVSGPRSVPPANPGEWDSLKGV